MFQTGQDLCQDAGTNKERLGSPLLQVLSSETEKDPRLISNDLTSFHLEERLL